MTSFIKRVSSDTAAHYSEPSSNPSPLDRVGEFVESCVEALPTMEETVEKVQCLSDHLLTLGIMGAGSTALGVMAVFRCFPSLKAVATGALAIPSAYLAASVVNEADLRREAALSQGSETVVYILPKLDSNAVTHELLCHKAVREVAQGRKFVVERISSPEELDKILAKQTNISHLWISLHGNADGIIFSRDASHTSNASIADHWPLDKFAPGAQVILESCLLGQSMLDPGERISNIKTLPIFSFAEQLQWRLGKMSVTAATKSVYNGNAKIKDDKVSFIQSGEDITVRFPRGGESSSETPSRWDFDVFKQPKYSASTSLTTKEKSSSARRATGNLLVDQLYVQNSEGVFMSHVTRPYNSQEDLWNSLENAVTDYVVSKETGKLFSENPGRAQVAKFAAKSVKQFHEGWRDTIIDVGVNMGAFQAIPIPTVIKAEILVATKAAAVLGKYIEKNSDIFSDETREELVDAARMLQVPANVFIGVCQAASKTIQKVMDVVGLTQDNIEKAVQLSGAAFATLNPEAQEEALWAAAIPKAVEVISNKASKPSSSSTAAKPKAKTSHKAGDRLTEELNRQEAAFSEQETTSSINLTKEELKQAQKFLRTHDLKDCPEKLKPILIPLIQGMEEPSLLLKMSDEEWATQEKALGKATQELGAIARNIHSPGLGKWAQTCGSMIGILGSVRDIQTINAAASNAVASSVATAGTAVTGSAISGAVVIPYAAIALAVVSIISTILSDQEDDDGGASMANAIQALFAELRDFREEVRKHFQHMDDRFDRVDHYIQRNLELQESLHEILLHETKESRLVHAHAIDHLERMISSLRSEMTSWFESITLEPLKKAQQEITLAPKRSGSLHALGEEELIRLGKTLDGHLLSFPNASAFNGRIYLESGKTPKELVSILPRVPTSALYGYLYEFTNIKLKVKLPDPGSLSPELAISVSKDYDLVRRALLAKGIAYDPNATLVTSISDELKKLEEFVKQVKATKPLFKAACDQIKSTQESVSTKMKEAYKARSTKELEVAMHARDMRYRDALVEVTTHCENPRVAMHASHWPQDYYFDPPQREEEKFSASDIEQELKAYKEQLASLLALEEKSSYSLDLSQGFLKNSEESSFHRYANPEARVCVTQYPATPTYGANDINVRKLPLFIPKQVSEELLENPIFRVAELLGLGTVHYSYHIELGGAPINQNAPGIQWDGLSLHLEYKVHIQALFEDSFTQKREVLNQACYVTHMAEFIKQDARYVHTCGTDAYDPYHCDSLALILVHSWMAKREREGNIKRSAQFSHIASQVKARVEEKWSKLQMDVWNDLNGATSTGVKFQEAIYELQLHQIFLQHMAKIAELPADILKEIEKLPSALVPFMEINKGSDTKAICESPTGLGTLPSKIEKAIIPNTPSALDKEILRMEQLKITILTKSEALKIKQAQKEAVTLEEEDEPVISIAKSPQVQTIASKTHGIVQESLERITELEGRLLMQETTWKNKFSKIETALEEERRARAQTDAKLDQIMVLMAQLLAKK